MRLILQLACAPSDGHNRPCGRFLLNLILNTGFRGSNPARSAIMWRCPAWECERRLKIKNNGVQGDGFRSSWIQQLPKLRFETGP
jgi:hypothetical protein